MTPEPDTFAASFTSGFMAATLLAVAVIIGLRYAAKAEQGRAYRRGYKHGYDLAAQQHQK